MRLFVFEHVTSGRLAGRELPASLAAEGRAMLAALLEDLDADGGFEVVTTVDGRIALPDFRRVEREVVRSEGAAREAFQRHAREADGVFAVAPELDHALQRTCGAVEEAGGRWLGCRGEAIACCSDKLALAERLREAGVATPVTRRPADWGVGPASAFPAVVKPRFGAGSEGVRVVWSADELVGMPGMPVPAVPSVPDETGVTAAGSHRGSGFQPERSAWPRWPCHDPRAAAGSHRHDLVVQPLIAGRHVSMAAVVDGEGVVETWPLGVQRLGGGGTFRYLGGALPVADEGQGVERLVRRAAAAVPGLRGYVGFDVVVPEDAPGRPVLIEINPRLTTSYVGYRVAARSNPIRRVLGLEGPAVRFGEEAVRFRPDGRIETEGGEEPCR